MNETARTQTAVRDGQPRRPRVELEPLEPGLASRYYTDPRWPISNRQRIFDRTWQLVGHVTDLPNPGSRIVGSVGRKEVVVVRTEDGGIRAHLNTCRHRGTRLVAGPGEEKALRCPYHGWTYHLDGTLVGAPENRTIPCLDKSKLSLFGARAEVFCGLIFVNLDLGRGAARARNSRVSGRCSSAISAARWNRSARPASMSTTPSTRNSRTGRWPSTTTSRATTSQSRTPG